MKSFDFPLILSFQILLDYANSSPAAGALLNLLSSHSTNITLFIPQNAGFHVNQVMFRFTQAYHNWWLGEGKSRNISNGDLIYFQTLSWRDLEYHISANNGVHFYDNLEHGMLVPSQLGYNLSVAVSSPNRSLDSVSGRLLYILYYLHIYIFHLFPSHMASFYWSNSRITYSTCAVSYRSISRNFASSPH